MKVLLDEAMPHFLRLEVPDHEIVTARYMGWTSYRNGELIRRAAEAGFEVFVTPDRGVEHQHNIPALGLAVIVLAMPANLMATSDTLIPELRKVLDGAPAPGTLTVIGSHRIG